MDRECQPHHRRTCDVDRPSCIAAACCRSSSWPWHGHPQGQGASVGAAAQGEGGGAGGSVRVCTYLCIGSCSRAMHVHTWRVDAACVWGPGAWQAAP